MIFRYLLTLFHNTDALFAMSIFAEVLKNRKAYQTIIYLLFVTLHNTCNVKICSLIAIPNVFIQFAERILNERDLVIVDPINTLRRRITRRLLRNTDKGKCA